MNSTEKIATASKNLGRLNDSSLGAFAKMHDNATKPKKAIDPETKFSEWQNRVIEFRKDLTDKRSKIEAKRQSLSRDLKPEAVEARLKNDMTDLAVSIDYYKNAARMDLEQVIKAKTEWFDGMFVAPSDEQLRLLQTLSLRTGKIDPDEAALYFSQVNNNLLAMHCLCDILQSNNISTPRLPDHAEFRNGMEKAAEFSVAMIESLDKPEKQLSYSEICFFKAPGTGPADAFYSRLDNVGFFAPQGNVSTVRTADSPDADGIGEQLVAQRSSTEKIERDGLGRGKGLILRADGDEKLEVIAKQADVSPEDIKRVNPQIDFTKPIPLNCEINIPSSDFAYSSLAGAASVFRIHPGTFDMHDPIQMPAEGTKFVPRGNIMTEA